MHSKCIARKGVWVRIPPAALGSLAYRGLRVVTAGSSGVRLLTSSNS